MTLLRCVMASLRSARNALYPAVFVVPPGRKSVVLALLLQIGGAHFGRGWVSDICITDSPHHVMPSA
jgi:hypothetical protein